MENYYEISKRSHLQTKYSCRSYNFIYGPYCKHNFLVHCGTHLQKENGFSCSEVRKRFWRIFPSGGRYSKWSDVISCIIWYILLMYPFIAIGIGSYMRNQVNIINCVILSIILMYQLLCVYIIVINTRHFKQLWCVSKIDIEKYMCLENVIHEVNKSNICDLDLIPLEKRKKITQKLFERTDARAVVMLCTRSFWKCCVIDPIIGLVIIAVLCLLAVLIELETIHGDILTSTHT